MGEHLACFKAYDIRGQVPSELDDELAYRIGRAYVAHLGARRVALGRDVRLSSVGLAQALTRGLTEAGADVFDIGLAGTEEVYFATFDRELDGGIAVTASHNPADYNGLKLVREGARPVSADSGLLDIERLVVTGRFPELGATGSCAPIGDHQERYVRHLLSYIEPAALRPLKLVVNAGNGGAGLIIDRLEPALPFQFIKLHHEPDGRFPNGIPNPLLPERRLATVEAIRAHGADLGIAWDGDFDRCFFFDEDGQFIEGYYLVGLLAGELLRSHPGSKILYDPRLTWNTIEAVTAAGGTPVQCKSGHAFIKERMRQEDAVYGGEMSGHHYFRRFHYCDSGMIPWLLVVQCMCRTGLLLSDLVRRRMQAYPCSGEINFRVTDPAATLERVLAHYAAHEPLVDRSDGIGLSFPSWRFNLRASNTEPLIRLNVESRGSGTLLAAKTVELRALIEEGCGG